MLAPKTVREMIQLPRDPVYNISHVKKTTPAHCGIQSVQLCSLVDRHGRYKLLQNLKIQPNILVTVLEVAVTTPLDHLQQHA